MYSLTQLKQALFLIVLVVFGLLPVQAVVPPPDGCYPNFTTAEGCNALQSLTTGAANTGVGWRSLFSNSTAGFNTAIGAGALVLNNADNNTAVGVAALLLNTNGESNVAVGTGALLFNDSGNANTASGAFALYNNTSGNGNTAPSKPIPQAPPIPLLVTVRSILMLPALATRRLVLARFFSIMATATPP